MFNPSDKNAILIERLKKLSIHDAAPFFKKVIELSKVKDKVSTFEAASLARAFSYVSNHLGQGEMQLLESLKNLNYKNDLPELYNSDKIAGCITLNPYTVYVLAAMHHLSCATLRQARIISSWRGQSDRHNSLFENVVAKFIKLDLNSIELIVNGQCFRDREKGITYCDFTTLMQLMTLQRYIIPTRIGKRFLDKWKSNSQYHAGLYNILTDLQESVIKKASENKANAFEKFKECMYKSTKNPYWLVPSSFPETDASSL